MDTVDSTRSLAVLTDRHCLSICEIPSIFLTAFGLLNKKQSNNKLGCLLDIGLKLLGSLFILTSWIFFMNNLSLFCGALFLPQNTTNVAGPPMDSIAFGLLQAPFPLITFRGAIVLTLFFFKRFKWQNLRFRAASVAAEHMPLVEYDLYLQKLRRWSIGYICLTSALVISWTFYLHLMDYYLDQVEYDYPMFAGSLPRKQHYVVVFLCMTLPTLVSQMIYISLVVLSKVLQDCTKKVNTRILQLAEEQSIQSVRDQRPQANRLVRYDTSAEALAIALEDLALRHRNLLTFCAELNEFFGIKLFFMYGIDALCCLAFVANYVTSPLPGIIVTGFTVYSIFVYFTFTIILLLPLILVPEEADKTIGRLHQLNVAVSHLYRLAPHQNQNLRGIFNLFLSASRDQSMVLRGADLIHITRGTLVATTTLTVSFAILIHEFQKK